VRIVAGPVGQKSGLAWSTQPAVDKCSTDGNMMENGDVVEQTMAGLRSLRNEQWRS